jgi:hypothetical protein
MNAWVRLKACLRASRPRKESQRDRTSPHWPMECAGRDAFPRVPSSAAQPRDGVESVPTVTWMALALAGALVAGCGPKPTGEFPTAGDPHLTTNGTVEVSARLVEIPEGAIFKRDLYDYATILKYEVLKVHRGDVKDQVIYVGHYNPWKPRSEAADKRVTSVGGSLRSFQAGQTHRMAMEVPIDDHFMGGIVNKYFGRATNALYWAVWTNGE